MTKSMKRAISLCAVAAAVLGISAGAQAQTTFQGVTFTPTWSGNVLTLEIDAAGRTDNWAAATGIGALQIKDIGSWSSVVMTGPGAASGWVILGNELNANGCLGGSGGGQRACASGTPVALTDDMVFTFTFTGGTQDFTLPHIKVNMFGENGQIGSLMSMDIPSVPAIPEPGTYAMLLGGLGVLALARRNAKKKAA